MAKAKKSKPKTGCKTVTLKSPAAAKAYKNGVNYGKKSNPAKINPDNKKQVIIC